MATVQNQGKVKESDLAAKKPIFSWQSPEFVRYEKDKRWYLGMVLVAAVLIVIFAIQRQWSAVVLIAVAATIFTILSSSKPKNISCAIYQEGVVVDGKVYSFGQFKSFWLTLGELPKIKLQLLGKFAGQVDLPMQDQDFEQIKLFFSKRLPEDHDKGEDTNEIINRIFRI